MFDPFPVGNKDIVSGAWQGWLGKVSRFLAKIDTTSDIIIDTSAKGIILKSPNLHYWRATISDAGVVTWTDLGLTKP